MRVAKPTGGKLRGVCEACGETVPNADRRHCDACDAKRIAEQGAALVLLGPQALQRMREEGRDPAHGGAPSQKRSATARMRRIAEIDWDRTHDLADPEEFTLGILPKLADCSLRELSKATGLSLRYCSLIRRGERVPHARHWAAFNSFA